MAVRGARSSALALGAALALAAVVAVAFEAGTRLAAVAYRRGVHHPVAVRPAAPHPRVMPRPALPTESPPASFSVHSQTLGLEPGTSLVSVVHRRQPIRLDPRQSGEALAVVRHVLASIRVLSPDPDGVRRLAMLRLSDSLIDVAVWSPQTLTIAGRRLADVSGIVIPFTGAWRHRVLVVRGDAVLASPPLPDSPPLAALEHLIDEAGSRP